MKLFSMNELLALSRDELLDLHDDMSRHLMVLSADEIERREALENLDNIRRVLNRPVQTNQHGGFLPPAP
jgi:hypothetical protein